MPPEPRKMSTPSPSLTRVAKGDLCSGCGACAALAPGRVTMAMKEPGYLRPVQHRDLLPDQEQAIAAICPGLGVHIDADRRSDDVLWGPLLAVRSGWATDPDIRHAGASGGVLTALCVWLLESGTVDGVVQITADPENPIGNVTVVSRTVAEIRKAAGSRYAPSAPLANLDRLIDEHLTTGHRFAVVGKPCDASALRAWTLRDANAAEAFPVNVSFFCGGIPSRTGAEVMLQTMGVGTERVEAFRYRGMGWPEHATARLADGSEKAMSYHDSWGRILSRNLQHRCKICADSSGMAADIVCADAWKVDAQGKPLFDEAPGVSLIIARTNLGQKLLGAAEKAAAIETSPFDLETLAAIQPGQTRRRQVVLSRVLAQKLVGRPVPRYRGLHLVRAGLRGGIRDNLRNFMGMLKRTWASR